MTDAPAAKPLSPRAVAASMGLLLAAALLGYGFLLRPGATPFSPHSDFLSEHLGAKQVLFDSIRGGRGLPLWRSDKLSGYEALTSPVSQYTYPLDAPFFFLPPLAAVGPAYWLHFLAAGVFYWLAAAALGLGFWPRLYAGLCGLFGLKLILAVYAGWLPNIPGIVCFPALLAAVFRLERSPGLGSSLLLALAGALCLHCGIYQLPFYAALFASAWLAAGVVSRRREAAAACGWAALSAVLALGLSAYLIVPLAAEAPLLSRGKISYGFFLSGHALRPAQLETFVLPESRGTPLDGTYPGDELWEDEAYFGALALLLAAAGLVWGRRRRGTLLLAGGFAASVALSADTPLLRALFERFPGFALFRIPSRFLFLAAFFGVALAGIGLEELLERVEARRGGRRRAALLGAALALLAAAEGAWYARRYLRMTPSAQAVPPTDYERFFAADKDLYRTATVGRSAITYGWAASKGLQLVTGNDSFSYRSYHQYFEILQWGEVVHPFAGPWFDLDGVSRRTAPARLLVRWDMLDALDVKYVASPEPLALEDGRWRLAARLKDQPSFVLYRGMRREDLWIYRNDSYRRRAFWGGATIPVACDDADVVAGLRRTDLRAASIVCGGGPSLPPGTGAASDAVAIERWAPGRLALSATARAGRFLVISESWHPGWRARIDGRPAAVYRTDGALLGLAVPPGTHRVDLEFAPPLWGPARLISAASALIFLGLAGWWAARRRSSRRPNW
ncbi:MAG TPA: DUF6541 family protein [Elusimicrobiota bacterium]|nr:DUF6541 family protein [Elusimicrobiota bacterium]